MERNSNETLEKKERKTSNADGTVELQPGIGFTEDTKHTLLANTNRTVTETILVDNNTSHANSSYSNSSQDWINNFEAVDTSTENVTEKVDNSVNNLQRSCIEREELQCNESITSGIFAINGKINYDCNKATNSVEANQLDTIRENLNELSCDELQNNRPVRDDKGVSASQAPVSKNVSNTKSKRPLRKGDSLSTDDLEDDTIHAVACRQTESNDVPDSVAADLPRVKLDKGVGPGCLLTLVSKRQSVGKTPVYIQHERATDSRLGDKFGATVETFTTHGTKYFEHFFTDIEKDGVADHMEIRSGDQLVLLNGIFVPDLDHDNVLQELSQVPVDSQTRLTLILLQYVTKKQWIWINTSAILVPEYLKEPPAVKDPEYNKSHGSSHEERKLFKLKVQETCMYVSISDGQVRLEVSECGGDMDRFNICVWTRTRLDVTTGRITYSACLYREDPTTKFQNDYVNVTDTEEVIVKSDPQWFTFGLLGRTQSYKAQELNKWLGCSLNYSTCGKLCLKEHVYYFNAYEVDKKLSSVKRLDSNTMDTNRTNRSTNYSDVDHEESSVDSISMTSSEGTNIDEPYLGEHHRSKVYSSKQSISNSSSADSAYGHSRNASDVHVETDNDSVPNSAQATPLEKLSMSSTI